MAMNEQALRDATSKAPVLVYSVNQDEWPASSPIAPPPPPRLAAAALMPQPPPPLRLAAAALMPQPPPPPQLTAERGESRQPWPPPPPSPPPPPLRPLGQAALSAVGPQFASG